MAAGDDSEIPESGAIFTFGKSRFGDNLPNKFWVRGDKAKSVACGDEHTALVTESGRLFTFGVNDWGQLGIDEVKVSTRPCCVKKLKPEKVKVVACGRIHTIVATESGCLYTFGANGDGQLGVEDIPSSNCPVKVECEPRQYKALAAGADHSVALTDDGELYVWGGGSEGQLGLGDIDDKSTPTLLSTDNKVISVACGYYHTAFVTDVGEVFTFGEGDGGKLGQGTDYGKAVAPKKVNIPEKAKSVACGGSHTVVLTECGKVYTFGEGGNGQLGHKNKYFYCETPVWLNFKHKVTQIAAGENHTALVTEKGQLYTFGDGRHAKLGLDHECYSNQYFPQRSKRFSKFIVTQVSCGGCHMIVLAYPRLQNGEVDSTSSNEEDENENLHKTNLNHSIKIDGTVDLGGSFGARDRRRQESIKRAPSLNRTLPALTNNAKTVESLSATHPPKPSPQGKRPLPQAVKPEEKKAKPEEESSEESEDSEEEEAEVKAVPESESKPVPKPRPLPRKQDEEETKSAKSDDEEAEETPPETKEDKEESKDSEESEEEQEPEPSQSEAPGAEVSQSASPEDETNQSEKDKEAIPSETKESVSLVVDFLSHLRRVCLCEISLFFY